VYDMVLAIFILHECMWF